MFNELLGEYVFANKENVNYMENVDTMLELLMYVISKNQYNFGLTYDKWKFDDKVIWKPWIFEIYSEKESRSFMVMGTKPTTAIAKGILTFLNCPEEMIHKAEEELAVCEELQS